VGNKIEAKIINLEIFFLEVAILSFPFSYNEKEVLIAAPDN